MLIAVVVISVFRLQVHMSRTCRVLSRLPERDEEETSRYSTAHMMPS